MSAMNTDELLTLHPRLYHMAQAGSWPSIRTNGLMTTAQIVAAYMPSDDMRIAALKQRRPHSIVLESPENGRVVIRDQAPLREKFLAESLTGMTMVEWLEILNGRVFFWLHPEKLRGLLFARRYRNEEHDVLTVDTASLVTTHGDRVRLSAINSGATLYPKAVRRGTETFLPIEDYPYAEMRQRRGPREAIVELAVIDGVPDIHRHVVRVERKRQDDVISVLYP
jgi:Family of unknown function (DUF7002)